MTLLVGRLVCAAGVQVRQRRRFLSAAPRVWSRMRTEVSACSARGLQQSCLSGVRGARPCRSPSLRRVNQGRALFSGYLASRGQRAGHTHAPGGAPRGERRAACTELVLFTCPLAPSPRPKASALRGLSHQAARGRPLRTFCSIALCSNRSRAPASPDAARWMTRGFATRTSMTSRRAERRPS